ncbi:MAG: YceI family protein [Desulfuromonadaceae bacterium]|nr:YceI family protein [Desulfuromonadaceae bacterium]
MFTRFFAILSVLLLVALTAEAAVINGQCSIRFAGDSTLHGFDGKAVCQPFTLISEKDSTAIEHLRPATIMVRVDSMDTANASRDAAMREMFDSKNSPFIEGLVGELNTREALRIMTPAADQSGKVAFELKIRGQVQRVQADVYNLDVGAEKTSFTLKFSLSLASFQLEPPSVIGIIRVADQVAVEVDVVLQPTPTID